MMFPTCQGHLCSYGNCSRIDAMPWHKILTLEFALNIRKYYMLSSDVFINLEDSILINVFYCMLWYTMDKIHVVYWIYLIRYSIISTIV